MPNKADYDFGAAFARIEIELINSMMRNMVKHQEWETAEGFQWEQWQALQLKALEEYKRKNKDIFEKQFQQINIKIEEAIKMAREHGNAEQEIELLEAVQTGKFKKPRMTKEKVQTNAEFFKLNDRKMEALIEATISDMEKAETAILRLANDKYRKIIFQAQVYANSGAGTYEKAVDMATRDFLAAGLNCVEYKNGSRHTLKDYADMAIRTATKRAYLTGEGEKRKEWGISTVIMNKRGNPCPKCLPFVGKILIDDVWSGGKPEEGNYPLMSSAIAAGLYHPRCQDHHTTYFEGISKTSDNKFTKAEINKIEEGIKKEVKRQYYKRQATKYERLKKYSLDGESNKLYVLKERFWKDKERENRVIEWPPQGERLSIDVYKELRNYAEERGIALSGFKKSDVDIKLAKKLIDNTSRMLMEFPELKKNGDFILQLYNPIDRNDIAETYPGVHHIIKLNAAAMRSEIWLEREYSNLVEIGWFAKGTTYESIIYHEIGHIISNIKNIDSMEIAKEILDRGNVGTIEWLKDNLSEYSVNRKDGAEIIAEVFSSYYGSANNDDFVLQFMEHVL